MGKYQNTRKFVRKLQENKYLYISRALLCSALLAVIAPLTAHSTPNFDMHTPATPQIPAGINRASSFDNRQRMLSNMFRDTIAHCLGQTRALSGGWVTGNWTPGGYNFEHVRGENIRNGWFADPGNTLNRLYILNTRVSNAYLRTALGRERDGFLGVGGVYYDQTFCGENENAILRAALTGQGLGNEWPGWNINVRDLICDGGNFRVFQPVDGEGEGYDCRSNFDRFNRWERTPNSAQEFRNRINHFVGSNPDTNATRYWYYYSNFISVCTQNATSYVAPFFQQNMRASWAELYPSTPFVSVRGFSAGGIQAGQIQQREYWVYVTGVDGAAGAANLDRANNHSWRLGSPFRSNATCMQMLNRIRQHANAATFNVEEDGEMDFNDGEITHGDGGEDVTTCDAGAMGWLLCPFTNTLAAAMDFFYNRVEDALTIRASLFNTNSAGNEVPITQSTAHGAWAMFRNMANVIFIIFFLVIIFSQLTGIGISNYGIKRALPKLVMTALLINLSFIVTVILVDISNIVGSQLNAFLSNLAGSPSRSGFSSWIAEILAGGALGTTLAVGGATVIGSTIASGGLAGMGVAGIIIAVLILLLVGLFAVLMFFAILLIREIAVLILVIVSPIAFACLLLPNTEGIFKKWWKIFSTLLILFPIVGLVFGGATLAQVIVTSAASGGDWFILFLALFIPLMPVFIVPSLVKGTLRLFGDIGAKAAGFSARGALVKGAKEMSGTAYGDAMRDREQKAKINRLRGLDSKGQKSKLWTGVASRRQGALNRISTGYGDKFEDGVVSAATKVRLDELGGDGSEEALQKAMDSGDIVEIQAQASSLAKSKAGIDSIAKVADGHKNAEMLTKHLKKNHMGDIGSVSPTLTEYVLNNGKGNIADHTSGITVNAADASKFKHNEMLRLGDKMTPELANTILSDSRFSGNVKDGSKEEAHLQKLQQVYHQMQEHGLPSQDQSPDTGGSGRLTSGDTGRLHNSTPPASASPASVPPVSSVPGGTAPPPSAGTVRGVHIPPGSSFDKLP